MGKRWIACVSQTGEELYRVSNQLGRAPDLILTTNKRKLIPEVYELGAPLVAIQGRPTPEQFDAIFFASELVTLHGFLYIIPGDICERYRIINGHPGAVHLYGDELKGKDPQVRAYKKYERYGCIIHEVINEVDAGRILYSYDFDAQSVYSLDELFDTLKYHAIQLWVQLLRQEVL